MMPEQKQTRKKRTLEFRKKVSERLKGNKYWLGKKHTEETKKKISEKLKLRTSPMLGRHQTDYQKQRCSEVHRGMKHTEESKRKIREARAKQVISEEHKRKIGECHKGNKCYFWNGGISFEPYSIDWRKSLKRAIRERDKYTCQICNTEPAIDVHHINYDKKNCNPDNLITLCHCCHGKTNNERSKWLKYFEDKKEVENK